MKDQEGKIIRSAVENLCAEKEFYTFSLDLDDEDTGEIFDYDKRTFDGMDGRIAAIAGKIISNNSTDLLTNNERENLAKYVTYQFYRSPAIRNITMPSTIGKQQIRQAHGLILLDNDFLEEFSNILIELNLKIVNPTENHEFIISDSPVLFCPTAEGIYFPISPKHCLYYYKEGTIFLDSILINELEFLGSVKFNIARSEDILKSIWNGTHENHVFDFCSTENNYYWKCILKTKDSLKCENYFRKDIHEDFERLMKSLVK
jgi:Protein of unknown function (DUF4238)